LDEEKVRAIRRRRREGASLSQLAREFGVRKGTIGKICQGLLWKHIRD